MTTRPRITPEAIPFGVEIETTGARRSKLAVAVRKALALDYVVGSWDHDVAPRQTPSDGLQRTVAGLMDGPNALSIVETHDGYDTVKVSDVAGRTWSLMNDGSVNGNATEVVTPKLCGDRDLATLQAVVRAVKVAGATVDDSCGVHVHVDGAPFKRDPVAVVRLAHSWARYEDLVGLSIDLLPARRNRWCKPVETEFLGRLDTIERARKVASQPLTVDDVKRAWYGFLPSGNVEHYNETRYRALNLHALLGDPRKCTVEFRCFNATLHAGKIKAYVQLARCTAAHALNATSVKRGRRDYDPTWTKYALWGLLKNLGMSGDVYATAREHLLALGKGAAGFRTAAEYHAWKVRMGRVEGEGAQAPSTETYGPIETPEADRAAYDERHPTETYDHPVHDVDAAEYHARVHVAGCSAIGLNPACAACAHSNALLASSVDDEDDAAA